MSGAAGGWKGNFIANVLGRTFSILVVFVVTPFLVRRLGLEGYALVGLFLALMGFTFVLDFALGATMTRAMAIYRARPGREDDARDLARSLEMIYAAVSVVIFLLCFFMARFLATRWLHLQHLSESEVIYSIRLMGACLALQAPIGMYTGGICGLERQKILNLATAGLSAARYGGVLVVLYLVSATPVAFFFWQLGFVLLQLVLFAVMFWRFMPRGTRRARFSRASLSEVSGFTSGMLVTAVGSFFLNQMDKFVLSKFMPFTAVGTYQIGNQVSNGVRMLPGLVDSVVLPRFAAYSESGDEKMLRTAYHEAGQIVAIMTVPAAMILVFFSHTLIALWLGSEQIAAGAAPIASILVVGSTLNAFMRVPYALTLARGWAMYGVYEFIGTLLVFIPGLIFLSARWGGVGAASAWLLVNVGFVTIGAPFIHHRVLKGGYFPWLVQDALVPAIVSIAVAGGGAWLMPEGLGKLAQLGFVAVCFFLCITACITALPHGRANARLLAQKVFPAALPPKAELP